MAALSPSRPSAEHPAVDLNAAIVSATGSVDHRRRPSAHEKSSRGWPRTGGRPRPGIPASWFIPPRIAYAAASIRLPARTPQRRVPRLFIVWQPMRTDVARPRKVLRGSWATFARPGPDSRDRRSRRLLKHRRALHCQRGRRDFAAPVEAHAATGRTRRTGRCGDSCAAHRRGRWRGLIGKPIELVARSLRFASAAGASPRLPRLASPASA